MAQPVFFKVPHFSPLRTWGWGRPAHIARSVGRHKLLHIAAWSALAESNAASKEDECSQQNCHTLMGFEGIIKYHGITHTSTALPVAAAATAKASSPKRVALLVLGVAAAARSVQQQKCRRKRTFHCPTALPASPGCIPPVLCRWPAECRPCSHLGRNS